MASRRCVLRIMANRTPDFYPTAAIITFVHVMMITRIMLVCPYSLAWSPWSSWISSSITKNKFHRQHRHCRQVLTRATSGNPWKQYSYSSSDPNDKKEIDIGDSNEDYNPGSALPPLFLESKPQSSNSGVVAPYINDVSYTQEVLPNSLQKSMKRVKDQYLFHGPSAGNKNDDADNSSSNENIYQNIVKVGIEWTKQQQQQNDEYDGLHVLSTSDMERVPGCIATVHLRTILVPLGNEEEDDVAPTSYRVIIEGRSDAMLSGGLLALVSNVIAGEYPAGNNDSSGIVVTAADVLQISPERMTSFMGLRHVLSQGRNDGMASMLRVIQSQIQSLLFPKEKDCWASSSSQLNEGAGNSRLSSTSSSSSTTSLRKPTVAMLLSGGVDSSVALHLLLEQNYNVTAFYLRIWLEDELSHLGSCPWEDDLRVCQSVCDHAAAIFDSKSDTKHKEERREVPLEIVSLGKEYKNKVVQYTIEEARRGRTPNPDIMCNSRVKFGCFLEYIEKNYGTQFDFIASGHYARLETTTTLLTPTTTDTQTSDEVKPKHHLFRAPDPVKDQSYFLCTLTQKQLSRVLFPLGNYHKSQVRELASSRFRLPNRHRPDSQGLCFLGKIRFDDFLSSYLGNMPGNVVDASTDEIIGRHNGLWYHTVGQRKGIGKVMHPLATAHGPWYVVAKDQNRNIIYVSNRYEEEEFVKARSEFEVEDISWIAGVVPDEMRREGDGRWKEMSLDMKIRHGPKIVRGTLLLNGDGSSGSIRLDKKDGGLAPGQYTVFYQIETEECLGAGVISESHWTDFLQGYKELVNAAGNVEKIGVPPLLA